MIFAHELRGFPFIIFDRQVFISVHSICTSILKASPVTPTLFFEWAFLSWFSYPILSYPRPGLEKMKERCDIKVKISKSKLAFELHFFLKILRSMNYLSNGQGHEQ